MLRYEKSELNKRATLLLAFHPALFEFVWRKSSALKDASV